MKVGIVGLGHVGSAMLELFKDATVYDKYKKIGSIEEINKCDVAFICVPTPANDDGSCDVSIVDDILNRVNTDLIILRSTVPIFYTETKVKELNKKIVFQPEYYGDGSQDAFPASHHLPGDLFQYCAGNQCDGKYADGYSVSGRYVPVWDCTQFAPCSLWTVILAYLLLRISVWWL